MSGLIFMVVPVIIFAGFVFVGISLVAAITRDNARTRKKKSSADLGDSPWTRTASPRPEVKPDEDFEGPGRVRAYEGSEIMYKENAVDELHSIERPDEFWAKADRDFVEGHLEHDRRNRKKT